MQNRDQVQNHRIPRTAAAPPGSRLGSKDDLRVRCGVSVGTFDEAVRLVQARGLVAMRPGPGGGLFQAHWRLHRYIASVSPNEMLRSLGTNLFDLIESATIRHTVGRLDLAERYELHRALVDAIDARDRDAAMGVLAMHAVRSDPRTATPA
ncbi:MAG TPA: FCD domain-containing protein [Jatrophihabitantaceae bacterium]|jgi:DNA-binding FadR family transcriptional regulator